MDFGKYDIDDLPIPYQSLDSHGDFIAVNEQWLKILGYEKREVIGRNFSEFLGDAHKQAFLRNFSAFKKAGQVRNVEFDMKRKDGSLISVMFNGMLEKEGDAIRTHCFFNDVTTVKKAQQALLDSEENWRSLVSNAPIFITIVDEEGVIQFINKLLPEYNLRNVIGRKTFDFISPKHHDMVRSHLKKTYRTGEFQSYEVESDPPGKWYETHLGPIKKEGRIVAITMMALDITQRKRTIHDLEESESKYRNIVENASEGINLVDEDGITIEWNKAMETITGIRAEEAIGTPMWNIQYKIAAVPVKDSKFLEQLKSKGMELLSKKDAPWIGKVLERDIIAIGGKKKTLQYQVSIIKSGRGFKICTMMTDITSQKEEQSRIKRTMSRYMLDDKSTYLIKERSPALSLEVLNDLSDLNYKVIVISRSDKEEYGSILSRDKTEADFIWLPDIANKAGNGQADINAITEFIGSMASKRAILIDRLDYFITRYGIDKTMEMVYRIRETAYFNDLVVILSVDPTIVEDNHIKRIEKETKAVRPRDFSNIPIDLKEILELVYRKNREGEKPKYTEVMGDLGISRPTGRKRIRVLVARGYIEEHTRGNSKVIEITDLGKKVLMV